MLRWNVTGWLASGLGFVPDPPPLPLPPVPLPALLTRVPDPDDALDADMPPAIPPLPPLPPGLLPTPVPGDDPRFVAVPGPAVVAEAEAWEGEEPRPELLLRCRPMAEASEKSEAAEDCKIWQLRAWAGEGRAGTQGGGRGKRGRGAGASKRRGCGAGGGRERRGEEPP